MKNFIEEILPERVNKSVNNLSGMLYGGYGRNLRAKQLHEDLDELNLKEKIIKQEKDRCLNQLFKECLLTKTGEENLKKHVESLNKKLTDIEEEELAIESKKNKTNEQLEKIKTNLAKGEEVHLAFTQLGGENVQLICADNVILDGFYLDARKFKKQVMSQGGQFKVINKKIDETTTLEIHCIEFDKNEIKNKGYNLLNALHKLKAISFFNDSGSSETGAGWCQIEEEEKVYLIREEHLVNSIYALEENDDSLIKKNAVFIDEQNGMKIKFNFKLNDPSVEILPIHVLEKKENGTVILTSGNEGIYAMHKQEAMAFLNRGLNVMLFDFRGYGLSQGKPSKEGFYRDIETAYQFVSKEKKQQDNKILFKALCFSGGAAAFCAAQHPTTNIFLDQTYSRLREVIQDPNILEIAPPKIKKKLEYIKLKQKSLNKQNKYLGKIASWVSTQLLQTGQAMTAHLFPDFDVENNIKQNKGKKAIFFVADDKVMSNEHVTKTTTSIISSKEEKQLIVLRNFGTHGSPWYKLYNSPADFLQLCGNIQSNSDKESKELDDFSNELTDVYVEQIEKRKKECDNLKNEKNKSNRVLELEREIDELNNTGNTVIHAIRNEATRIKEKAKEEIDQIRKSVDKELFKKTYTGRAQMDKFLREANLSDDILKS